MKSDNERAKIIHLPAIVTGYLCISRFCPHSRWTSGIYDGGN